MVQKALLGLGLALLVLGAIEAGLRLRYSAEALLFEWERPTGLVATSETGDVVTRPNMVATRTDGPYTWHIRLNDLGFREDGTVPRAAPAGTLRILALGDSWIFGYSVDQGATIPDLVEARLAEQLGRPVEVVNAGVFGSGAFDMLTRYRQLVDAYRPDALLLGQPHNAAHSRSAAATRHDWYRRVGEGPASTLRTYLLLRRWMAPYRSGMYAAMPVGKGRDAEYQDMRTLAEDAQKRGLPVWFVEFPDRLGGAPEGYHGSGDWTAALAGTGVRSTGHRLDERACWGFEDHGHPSAAGAWVIAAMVARMIVEETSLPVSDAPKCLEAPAPGPGQPAWPWQDAPGR